MKKYALQVLKFSIRTLYRIVFEPVFCNVAMKNEMFKHRKLLR